MTQEDMPLEKALEVIKQIAERFERDHAAAEMAERVNRDRADTLHDQATTSSDGSGHEDV
jgi:hypothetical protein